MKQFFGAAMLGCGILIAGLSGLCTLIVVSAALLDGTGTQDAAELVGMIPAVLIVGGIPCFLGIGLFLIGRSLVRSAGREAQEKTVDQAEIFK